MVKINTNLSSLLVQSNLHTSTCGLESAIERMTTGFKINHAKDNAANFSINTKLSSKISSYEVAEDNVNQAINMVSTASGSLAQMSDMLSSLRSIAMQAQNGTMGDKSLLALSLEAESIIKNLYQLKNNTRYGDRKLFVSDTSSISNDAKELKLNSSGFLQDIVRRETSSMTSLSGVDETQALAQGTYSISTAEEFAKLASMNNSGLITAGSEFVLAGDIDLSAYASGEGWVPIGNSTNKFNGIFDGNGYTISNLYVNRPKEDFQALFAGAGRSVEIKNLKLDNVNITGRNGVAGIDAATSKITNCSVQGTVTGSLSVGGVAGTPWGGNTQYCYADVEVTGTNMVGGITGFNNYSNSNYCISRGNVAGVDDVGGICGNGAVKNCSSSANVNGVTDVGGIAGVNSAPQYCYFNGKVNGDTNVGGILGGMSNAYKFSNNIMEGSVIGKNNVGALLGCKGYNNVVLSDCYYDGSLSNGLPVVGDNSLSCSNVKDISMGTSFNIQVGINSSPSSSLTYNTYISLPGLDAILNGGITNPQLLSDIDSYLLAIDHKNTELGTIENRLMSVLEEISIKYDNLVSTRSTIRDADIAEESSAYIRNQILQQASATLLASANQTPAIALQLL